MDDLRILVELQCFFTRAQAADLGYDDRAVSAAMRHGLWHRIRRGYYTFLDTWLALDEVGQHRVRSRAVLHSLGRNVALSHVSGLVDAEVATWGMDLRRVHVTRLDGAAGRVEGDVVHHEGLCLDSDVLEKPYGNVLLPVRCALEAGSRNGAGEAAYCALCDLLHRKLCTQDELFERFKLMEHWPFMRRMHIPVRMADGRVSTVGEGRGVWLCWLHRLPAPEPQYEVREPGTGRLVATVDWGWPDHETFGEFDGFVKYGRLLKPGQDAGSVVFAEKQREDEIRDVTGGRVVRVIWSDYDRPHLTAQRIRRKLFPKASGE